MALFGRGGKTVNAGALVFDDAGKLLILGGAYKQGWFLPGGGVEAGESPLMACLREVKEETGLTLHNPTPLCIDWRSDNDSLLFLFDGGITSTTNIKLNGWEIQKFCFVAPSEALEMLDARQAAYLETCLPYIGSAKLLYLENGALITT